MWVGIIGTDTTGTSERTARHALSHYLKLACVEYGPDEGSSDVWVAMGVFQGIPIKD